MDEPAAIIFQGIAACIALVMMAVLSLALTEVLWKITPEWLYPVRGRWRRYLLTGCTMLALIGLFVLISAMARR